MENTLLLGNGFVRALYEGAVNWRALLKGKSAIELDNLTLLYEAGRLANGSEDDDFKRSMEDELRKQITEDKIKKSAEGVNDFGEYLRNCNINNIITTNMDEGIETILCTKNGYALIGSDSAEKVYSIRRKIILEKDGHNITIWKIHGDIKNVKSISFGFDQYVGRLSRIEQYVKGKYSSDKANCSVPMIDKIKNNKFDGISWIELFFNSNIFIAGFGLDYSEIDLWWILIKRCRIFEKLKGSKNRIVYLYSDFDCISPDKLEEKRNVLLTFEVENEYMMSGSKYIESLFSHIK
ncbi:MAG: SIR2 family protein [Lachnospiraceae bacterium]|nr:SIR2 family protein [Lachnospiraceae bacterium]